MPLMAASEAIKVSIVHTSVRRILLKYGSVRQVKQKCICWGSQHLSTQLYGSPQDMIWEVA